MALNWKRILKFMARTVGRSPATVFVMRAWRERLTRSGRFVMIGASATAIAAGFPTTMSGTVAFSFFVGLMITSVACSLVSRPRVAVQRLMAERCMEGQTIPLTIRVRNESRRVLLDLGAYEFRLPKRLQLLDEAQYINRLPPRESHDFQYRLHAERRGHYVMHGPTGLSAFPFALTHAKRYAPQTHRLVVFPKFHPIQRIRLEVGHRYQPGGVALLSKVGESLEFVGSREYRAGDRVRDIHPRSWARVGRPVVRLFQQEFMTRVAMLVDTYVPRRVVPHLRTAGRGWDRVMQTRLIVGPDREHFEANLSLAAAVADYLARQDYLVDLFAAGPQLYHFQAGRSLAHLDNILEILACLDRSKRDSLGAVAPAFCEQLRQMSDVVLLLVRWDKPRAELVQTLRSHGMAVRVVLVSDDKREAQQAIAAGATHLTVVEALAGVDEL